MPVKYVFWDSDNTLVNTYAHHWNKHVETLKSLGIHLGAEWKDRIYTNNGAQNWEWLSADMGLKMPKEEYLDAIDAWYYAHIDQIELRDGIEDALTLFEKAGVPMGVVSNGRKRSVMTALEAKKLTPYFNFVLTIEDYQGRKPDPAPYLAAKTKMQQIYGHAIDPQDCLVIEDDPKGVQAAIAAGMNVIDRPIADQDTAAFLAKCATFV